VNEDEDEDEDEDEAVFERIGCVAGSVPHRILELMESIGHTLVAVVDPDHPSRFTMTLDDGEKCLVTIGIEWTEKESE